MIPKIIHFSVSKKTTVRQEQVIQRAKELHPDWSIRIWHDDDIIPGGRLQRFRKDTRSGAQLADLIRLDAVEVFGGFYLDADLWLLKPLLDLSGSDSLVICSEDGVHLTNAFFGAPVSNISIGRIIARLLEDPPDWSRPPNETTGPNLFSSVLQYDPEIVVLPRESFYPYNWNEAPRPPHPAAHAVHEWENSWKKKEATKPKRLSAVLKSRVKSRLGQLGKPLRRIAFAVFRNELKRMQSSGCYPMSETVVCETSLGIRMALSGRDLSLTPSLALRGEYEPVEEKFVHSVVNGGDWVIDVGANVGLFTLIAATKCGPFGRVFAIEPNDFSRELLRKSCLMNWVHERVTLMSVAASDRSGAQALEGSSGRLGDFRLRPPNHCQGSFEASSRFADDHEEKSVLTSRLDQLFPLDVPIKLLKVDAEGHEAAVLRGASRLLERRCVKWLMIEASRATNGGNIKEFLNELYKLLNYGYVAGTLAAVGGEFRPCGDINQVLPHIGHVNLIFRAQE